MSRYIGKRVIYSCGQCYKQFTLNKKAIDDSRKSGEVFCSQKCFDLYLSERKFPLNTKQFFEKTNPES